MGIVYRATQLALGRPVALKLLTAQLAADDGFRERFRREWETAAAIDHPNVIPLYEAGEYDGTLFIAMRFVEGVDLAYMSADGPMAAARAVPLVAQIAAALDAAHARGLVHRDVKPANVLVGEGDHAYLSDFGLSREASQTRLTRTGLFVGSTDYAAPEQVRGEATDARTDVYALGCVLFQLLTGSVPFARSGDMAKMYAHITEPPPLVSDTQPRAPRVRRHRRARDGQGPRRPLTSRRASSRTRRWPRSARPRPRTTSPHRRPPPWRPRAGTPPRSASRPCTPSAATPSGSVSGWAAGPAGTASGAAVAATPAGLGGPAGGSSPLADVPGSRAATPVAAAPPAKCATAAPTGFATPARAAGRRASPRRRPRPIIRPPRVGGREWGRESAGRDGSAPRGRRARTPAGLERRRVAAAPRRVVATRRRARPRAAEPRVSPWPKRRRVALIAALPTVLVAGIAAAALAAPGVFEGDAPRAVAATPTPPPPPPPRRPRRPRRPWRPPPRPSRRSRWGRARTGSRSPAGRCSSPTTATGRSPRSIPRQRDHGHRPGGHAARSRRRRQGRRVGRRRRGRTRSRASRTAERPASVEGGGPAGGDRARQAAAVGREPQRRDREPRRPGDAGARRLADRRGHTSPRGSSWAAGSCG